MDYARVVGMPVENLLGFGERRCGGDRRPYAEAQIDLVNNRLMPTTMETRAALAEYEPATKDFTLDTSPHLSPLARVLLGP